MPRPLLTALIFLYLFNFLDGLPKEFSIYDTTYINGHLYYGASTQPYFRVKHPRHAPVLLSKLNESDFGKHSLPDNDVFVAHNWTEAELKYLPCLDLLCVCPFFNGSVLDDACVLPNGDELKPAVRKEYRSLTDVERHQFEEAIKAMSDSGIYKRLGRVHRYAGVHSGPGFFPWHREYLKRFELVLRTFLPMGSTLGLPYWDSTLDAYLPTVEDSVFFSVHLTGDVDEDGLLVYGPYANMSTMEGNLMPRRALGNNSQGELFTEARIDVLLDQKEIEGVLSATLPLETCPLLRQYPLDERFFEFSHDYVHYFIGGDFETTYSSTNDVIFFWHHTFVDFIWEMWRQKIQTREEREVQYPEPFPDCFPPLHFANATMHNLPGRKIQDGLLNAYTDKMYKIAPRPRCSNARPDCGSRYLFCDTANFDRPRCQSKVKLGGNCTGYEAFDICYEGSCYDGRCQALPSLIDRISRWFRRLFSSDY